MTDEIAVMQDLCNCWGIQGTLRWPVDMRTFLAGATAARELGRDHNTDGRHMLQCITKMYEGIGPVYFHQLFDMPADVDDMWVHYWCPQPPGCDLSKAQCPAGTTPLWTNGSSTVFVRPSKDKHGNDLFDFAVT